MSIYVRDAVKNLSTIINKKQYTTMTLVFLCIERTERNRSDTTERKTRLRVFVKESFSAQIRYELTINMHFITEKANNFRIKVMV